MRRHAAGLTLFPAVAGLQRRKGMHHGSRTTWISLMPCGRRARSAHVAALRALISGMD